MLYSQYNNLTLNIFYLMYIQKVIIVIIMHTLWHKIN